MLIAEWKAEFRQSPLKISATPSPGREMMDCGAERGKDLLLESRTMLERNDGKGLRQSPAVGINPRSCRGERGEDLLDRGSEPRRGISLQLCGSGRGGDSRAPENFCGERSSE